MSADLAFSVDDRRKRGYFTIDNVLLDIYGKELGAHGIAVYAALARFANSDQECWPTYRTITERTGVSRMQIVREIAKMEKLGIISVTRRVDERGNRTSHLYALLDIVGGGITQIPGGDTPQIPPSTTQVRKQSPIKNATQPNNKKKDRDPKSYRPAEFADIII